MFPFLFALPGAWKWAAGLVVVLTLVSVFGVQQLRLNAAKSDALIARSELQAERLTLAEALATAQANTLETQDRASDLVRNSAKAFDAKIAQIRTSYAARRAAGGGGNVPAAVQPDGVRAPADPAGGSGGPVPEATGPAGQPDGTASDNGTARPLDERCAETTQQLLDLQEYVRGLQVLFNSRR